MKIQFCKSEFRQYGNSKLDTFSGEVKNGIYTNPTVFVTPAVSESDFSQTLTEFSTAAAEYSLLGITKRTVFENKRQKLIRYLDILAKYTDRVAQGDVSIIALSGFIPSSSSKMHAPVLDKLQYFLLKRTEVAGEIIVDIQPVSNKGAVSYGCLCVEGAPLNHPVFVNGQLKLSTDGPAILQDANKSRRKVFTGLTLGVVYFFYVYATNPTGVSPLSDPKNILAA